MIARVIVEGLLALLLITEVIWPLWQGRPLFPLFRHRRQSTLLSDLERARQELDEDDIEELVVRLRAAHKARQKDKEEKSSESS